MKNFTTPIYQVDAFSKAPFQGNPAAVCPLSTWLDDELLQHIAAENNLAETAFFVAEDNGFKLRWFTPQSEVELCGHATLASAWVLYNELGFQGEKIKFNTLSGELIVNKKDHLLRMDFPAKQTQEITTPIGLIEALGCTARDIHSVHKSDDILVEFYDENCIDQLNPNFELLKSIDTRGIVITSRSKEFDFISRWFGPRVGVNEDSVTGSAHTTLTPYWMKKNQKSMLTAQQGGNRKGQLYCEISEDGKRVFISGEAVLVLKGELILPIDQ